MQPNTYQAQTKKTWNLTEDFERRVLNATLGLAGEVGEVVELVKKDSFHGKPLSVEDLQKELGDICYYLARLADEYGIKFETILEKNIEKLRARYPQGFVEGGGIR